MDLRRQIKNKIYELYSNSALADALNGLYWGKAPSGVNQDDFPIATYYISTSLAEYNLGTFTPKREILTLTFKILSGAEASTEAENICETLTETYDGASLSLTGWTLLEMARTDIAGPYLDDMDVWNVNVTYRLLVEKT